MIAAPRLRRLTVDERRSLRTALPFIAPWIVGFIAFTLYPIFYSLYLSFTRYSGFGDATPVGFENYTHMASDPLFWQALGNTFYYTALAVPVGVVVAIALAMMMNQNVREVAFYRAAFYLPSILPLFALTFIFIVLLNPGFGLVDYVLELVGLRTKADLPVTALTIPDRKRLEVARAVATRPRLLLLDEVMAGLNDVEIDDALDIVRTVRDTGVTVVLIEHVMRVIVGVCQRVIVLDLGRPLADGPPDVVLRDQRVIEAYLGEKYARRLRDG